MNKPILLSEITGVISKLENNKSPGPDTITNSFLKRLSKKRTCRNPESVQPVTGQLEFIHECGTAQIFHQYQNLEKHTQTAHFRPIAVSSCLGRVLEKILADRLQLYCVASEIFNNQCGFQTNRSTTDLLALLLNDAKNRPG